MQPSPSGTAQSGQQVPGETVLDARPYHWFLRRLDSLLRQEQRQAPPDQLSRYRVLVVSSSLLLMLSVMYWVLSLSMPDGFHLRISSACVGLYVLALALVRGSDSPVRPGVVLCSVLAGTYILIGIHGGDRAMTSHVATTLIPLLAFFLLGSQGGMLFALLMGLYVLILFPLFAVSSGAAHSTLSGLAVSSNLFVSFCIMGVWGLSHLHTRARHKAQAALEQTLKSLRDSERKLSSMVESTDDIVCSFDMQGRLLTSNTAHRQWFTRVFGDEPRLGEPIATPGFLQRHSNWAEGFTRARLGERVRTEIVYPQGGTSHAMDFLITPIPGEDGQPVGVTILGRDTTARKQAEARLSELHRTLLETSRQAGMAEMATGVLHNVGNTLNSVNISVSVLEERLRGLRVPGLVRAAELLHEHGEDLGTFLTRDDKGRRLPEYFLSSTRQLAEDQSSMLAELHSLAQNVDHIKSVVQMQQSHARVVGMVEEVTLPELLDDALRLHATSFDRLGIQVRREYAPLPPFTVDRHKLLQILVNLLSNARHALLESPRPDKQLTLRVNPLPGDRLRIEVADNGIGISPENLPRIFSQGFTTKRDGHGFGLHASALAATEMKGSLTCASAGLGQGATFTIELPLTPEPTPA
jgi:two-component system sensor kinase FixL